MSVNKFIMNKFKSVDYDKMNKILDIICKENNKSKIYVIFDLIKNFLTRGVGYTDYFRGNYINLDKKQKDTFVTTKTFYIIHNYLNDPKYLSVFNDKLIFNMCFKKYLKREYVNLRECDEEEFNQFIKDKKIVFAKTPTGFGGHGVSKIEIDKYKGNLYKKLIKNGQLLVEEAIIQSKELNEINPWVVNSLRIVTLYKDGKVTILNNALRVNQGSDSVIGCIDDLYFSLNEDGTIKSNVIDDYGNIYDEHPLTKKKFKDVKIKYVKEAFDMVKQAALLVPQVRYVGWDVAFADNGPLIVEGNEYPGYGLIQFYKLENSNSGHLKQISDVLKDEMKNIKI